VWPALITSGGDNVDSGHGSVIRHVTDDPDRTSPKLRLVPDLRPLVCPVLVGRDDLLDLADRRIAEVTAGGGRFLLLAGEAGVGKTRLLGAMERRAAASGFRTVRGGAYPSDLQVPGAILIDLARAMQRQPDLAPLGARLAERLDDRPRPSPPDTTDGAAAADGADPQRRRRLLVLDVAELLAEAAADALTVVALEDLHWTDDLTLEVLEALARRVPDTRLLLIGTYRSDELFPRAPMREWRSRLLGSRQAEEVRLGRLSAADTATMTTLLVGTGLPAARDVAEAIHARTDGIPLHVEELLGLLAASPGAGAEAVRAAEVPETVEDAILARLEHRSADATSVAQAGAVIGRSFDLDLLASVTGRDPDELSAPLRELADHFILLPASVPGRYGFRHALICDAIYAQIPEPDRRRLHARTADAASERPEFGTGAFLALHFERAGQREDAFRAAVAAADAATALSSHTEARELYACALRTVSSDVDPMARARILEAFGASATATDENQGAADAFEAAREAYRAAGQPLAAAAVVGPLVAARHLLGDDLDARAARLRGALHEISAPPGLHGPSIDPDADRVRARLLAALAAAYMLDRRLDESISYGTEARRLAEAVDDRATEHDADATLGVCFVFAGRMDEGWSTLERAIARSRLDHLDAQAARAYRMLGSSASVLVEYDRAEKWLRDGISEAERHELWNHRHYMAAHLAHVAWATGRWGEADDIARRSLADGRGGITTRTTALHVIGYVALGRGELEAASTALQEARHLGLRMKELQRLSPALWGLAEVALARGDAAGAVALAEEGRAASANVQDAAYLYPFLVTGTRAYLAMGDPAGARRWAAALTASISARGIPGTLPAVEHAAGLLALSDGATGKARTALGAATAGWDLRRRTWEGTWAVLDLARAHHRANLRADAARLGAQARDTAAGLGARAIVEAAEDLLRQAAHGSAPEPWAPLTAREFEIARCVAEGLTNVEIAAELGITPKTAASHVEHILAKLGVGRRAEIAAWAASRPVLDSSPSRR
jgi:DNA-binding CsgD family transcriptional regulator/tetratricopeptide (TPR) repeat protein